MKSNNSLKADILDGPQAECHGEHQLHGGLLKISSSKAAATGRRGALLFVAVVDAYGSVW